MFLDKLKKAKFRSSYGFNFFVIIGLFVFAFITYTFISLYFLSFSRNLDEIGTPIVFCSLFLMIITAIAFIISLIIYIFERLLNISIKNEKFLNSNFVLILQILSLISMTIPFIYIGSAFL